MARTSAKAQLSRMQIVAEEKRLINPINNQSINIHGSNSSLSGSGGSNCGSMPGSLGGSGNNRSAASTLIRNLPESQSGNSRNAIDLVLSSSSPGANSGNTNFQPPDDQQHTTLSGLAHPTQFHLTQLEKKHQHIRSLLTTHTPVQNQPINNTNVISLRGDVVQEASRTTASTNSPNGMGSTDRIEDLELVGLTSEFMEETDINRIEPTMSYDGPTVGSILEHSDTAYANNQHRIATSVVEGFQIGSGGALGVAGNLGNGANTRRSAPSSLPARFNFNSGSMVPVRQVSGASGITGTSVGCMPAVVGSAESGGGTTVGGGGGQSSSRAASRSSLMVPDDEGSNSAEMKQRQKKDQHNKVERKRREQINHFIAMLGDMLPKRMFEGNDNKKNKGTVLRKTTELIEKLSDDNRELRALLRRSSEVLQSMWPLINSAVENNAIHLTNDDLNNYMEVLQALLVKDRTDILTDSPGQPVGELSPSSAASCPPADTPMSMHPPTPSGLSAVPENSSGNASGSLTSSIPPSSNANHMSRSGSGENHSVLLNNARSAPSSLSTHYFTSRTPYVKEEESDMFSSHDLTHVEPGELHTLLAQISSPPSKHEPTDRSFNQSTDNSQLNTSSPSYTNLTLGFIEDMDTNDGVTGSHIIVGLESGEGMDM